MTKVTGFRPIFIKEKGPREKSFSQSLILISFFYKNRPSAQTPTKPTRTEAAIERVK